MKLLSRWVAILGMTSASLLGPALGRQMSALALPEQQVMQMLAPVPLFMITNAKGEPLAAATPDPKDKSKQVQVYWFFVSQQDAQKVVNDLKAQRPEVGNSARVSPASLSGVVQFAMRIQKTPGSNLGVEIVPSRAQLDLAIALLRQDGDIKDQGGQLVGKDGKPFQPSVPLFFIADAQTSAPLGLQSTIKENGKDKVISSFPFFFKKEDLQAILDQSRKQDPTLANKTRIKVAMLPSILNILLTNNDPNLGQFELVPPRESIAFIQSQPAQPQPAPASGQPPAQPPARPTTAPAAPARPPVAPPQATPPQAAPSPAPAAPGARPSTR
jgi:Tic22-like family